MTPFKYHRPETAEAAIGLFNKHKHSRYIAGATNLLDLMKKDIEQPEHLVDINQLPLKDIRWNAGVLELGALALNSEAAEHPLVQQHQPLVGKALLAGASPQLRNMATIGGNLLQRTRCPYFYDVALPCNKRNVFSGCGAKEGLNRNAAIFGTSDQCVATHPSDLCVALAALNASVAVHNGTTVNHMPFSDFHRLPGDRPDMDNNLQPGHLITAVHIPANNYNKYEYLKIRDRASYAFALVSVAVAIEMADNTIKSIALAAGGVAHKPWRLQEAERFLTGKTITEAHLQQAGALAVTNAVGLKHNAFKIKMLEQAVQTAIRNAMGSA